MLRLIKIIGAGMVGLALANRLAQHGIAVELIEKQLPDLDFTPGMPIRVSAVNLSSRDLLRSLGVWQAIRRNCIEPFSKIKAWTEKNNGTVHFDAADIGKKYLAYVVENREIVRVLWEAADNNRLVSIKVDNRQSAIGKRESVAEQSLIIGADGANSQVRKEAGIHIKERAYGQQAIVATIHSHKIHGNTAYQNFLKTGPIGVLPLYDPHLESIVWSADDAYVQSLMAMSDAKFNIALSNALNLHLGKLTLQSKRHLFPLIMRHAEQYVKPSIALVGDAAHTIHPLAGQGVNLGFKDVRVLSDCLIEAARKGLPFGTLNVLRKYERMCKWDNANMIAAMQVFRNHGHQLGWGFGLVEKCAYLKRKFTTISG